MTNQQLLELAASIIAYLGNLAIGVGTIFLGIIVLIVNSNNSSKDRKIHIADKRKDWMVEFRNLVGELLDYHNVMISKDLGNIKNTEEFHRYFSKLYNIQYKIRFMLPDNRGKDFLEIMDNMSMELSKAEPVISFLILERKKLINITNQILEQQRNDIAILNSYKPLI